MAFHWLVWAGARPDGMLRWLALFLTYSVHAAVWAGVAAVATRRRESSPSSRNLYLKLAMFGPILTTLATAALPVHAERAPVPATGHGTSVAAFTTMPMAVALSPARAELRPLPALLLGVARDPVWGRRTRVVALGAAGAAGFGLLRFVGLLCWLRRRLCTRRAVRDPRVLERLEYVRARSELGRVALSQDPEITSPLVIGRREICIPLATVSELSDAELDTVLAHELAHLERGDGFWFPAVGLIEAVLWLHPFNHWVARRFRESAEFACDDRAVVLTGDPLGLASALVQVAGRAPRLRRLALAPTMVRAASALVPRVRRLTGTRTALDSGAVLRGRRWAVGSFCAFGVVIATLSVQVVEARTDSSAATAMRAVTRPADVANGLPPDATERSLRVAETLRRERELERALAAASALPAADEDGTPAAVRVLELQQELRHTRATEIWLEQSFVEQWAGWEQRRTAAVVR